MSAVSGRVTGLGAGSHRDVEEEEGACVPSLRFPLSSSLEEEARFTLTLGSDVAHRLQGYGFPDPQPFGCPQMS